MSPSRKSEVLEDCLTYVTCAHNFMLKIALCCDHNAKLDANDLTTAKDKLDAASKVLGMVLAQAEPSYAELTQASLHQ